MSTAKQKTLSTAEYIPILTERIVEHCDPLRIILFGSSARGDAGPDSDIDLLIVLHEATDKRRTAIDIRRQLADLPVSKDIVVTTPEEIEQRGNLVGTILRPALREGRVIYERA